MPARRDSLCVSRPKYGPFKSLCANSSDFAHRDLGGTTEHCVPSVSLDLSLGPRADLPAPPISC